MSSGYHASAFSGTAKYYAQCRPPYPVELLTELRTRAAVSGSGTLVDLASGPGRVAIPMAPYFSRVVAIDVEAEMIEVGRAVAADVGVANIDWRVGRAEALQLPACSIELVTIGEAFHRLEQPRILASALEWLGPSGALATLAGESPWHGRALWQRAFVDVVNEWTHGALGEPADKHWGGPGDLFRGVGLRVSEYQLTQPQRWTRESVVGFMLSTSIASHAALGDRTSGFEAALSSALLKAVPGGEFRWLQRFAFTLGVAAPGR